MIGPPCDHEWRLLTRSEHSFIVGGPESTQSAWPVAKCAKCGMEAWPVTQPVTIQSGGAPAKGTER